MKGENKFNKKILKYLVGLNSKNKTYSKLDANDEKIVSFSITNNKSGEMLQLNFENNYIFFTFFEVGIYEAKSIKNIKDSQNLDRYFNKTDDETQTLGLSLLLKYYLTKINERKTTFQ